MSYRDLIGKPAPPIELLNYDGESFTFTPGEKDVPTALFFYPESGVNGRFLFLSRSLIEANTMVYRFVWMHETGLSVSRCDSR